MRRAVPGYEGYYEVSDDGRVFSLPREVPDPRPGLGVRKIKGREMSISTGGRYPAVKLTINGNGRMWRVHQLMALAFIGPCPKGFCVDHINENKLDNRLANLRYMELGENVSRSISGEKNHAAKLNQQKAATIRHERRSGESLSSIATRWDVGISTIHRVVTGKLWA